MPLAISLGKRKAKADLPPLEKSPTDEPHTPDELPSTTVDQDEGDYLTGAKLLLVLLGLGLAILLLALDVAVIATAIPYITARFHSTTDIGWYGAAYPLTICALQPLGGKLYALFSLKKTFLSFFSVFMFGSLLCAVSVSSNMFITGRAVAGAGAAGLLSGGLAIIAVVAPLSKRALYTGLLTSLFGLATVAGPLMGGALTQRASWRWCFYINLPAGAVTVAVLLIWFKPPRRSSDNALTVREKIPKLDLVGCALFIPTIVMILLALQWGGNQHAWRSATIIGLFCGFGGGMTVFLLWERHRGDDAMIPFSILFNRSVILSCCYQFLVLGGMIIPVYYMPEWFQVIKGATPLHSGVMQLPAMIAQTLGSLISGVIVTRTGYYNPWFFIGMVFLCVANGLYTSFTPSTNHLHWIPFQVLQGLGAGLPIQMAIIAVQAVLADKPPQIPVALSLVLFFQYFGASFCQSIALTVFQNRLITGLTRDAGLDSLQVDALLLGGSSRVRQVIAQLFPDKLTEVMYAYNRAITGVFYIPVACTILAFFLATGIEWRSIKGKSLGPPVAIPTEIADSSSPIKIRDSTDDDDHEDDDGREIEVAAAKGTAGETHASHEDV